MVEKKAWPDAASASEAAAALSQISGVSPDEMFAAVAGTNAYEIAVARGLSYEQAQAVRELGLSGVRLFASSRRVYPEGNLAAQLLGFVGRDNSGLTGLESDLNEVLCGANGTLTYERDGLGNQLALGERREVAAQPGSDVVLTIDRYIQRLAKLVTMACALDLVLVGPYTPWYDEGVFRVDSWAIRNWDFSANGDQSVTQILSKSLNTGAAWLSSLAGPDQFYSYVDRFGFGKPTGSGLGGEVGGRVRTPASDPGWRTVDMATNSFGQGLSATPLQMVMAAAAIANDGLAMKPKFVKEIAYPGQSQVALPEAGAQVIKPETARTLREMMGVVVDGISPSLLDVDGYKVGGKTGTANLTVEGGGYKPDAYISSFLGIAPLDNPVLAVLVKIDEPQGTPWGTVVAAPAFEHIVEAALPYMKVAPTETALVSDSH